MGGGRGEDEAIALPGQHPGQFAALAAVVGDGVALVDDDHVPARLFDVVLELSVLQRIDADDGLVEVVEGILIGRQFGVQPSHPQTIELYQGDTEAVPQLLLELA